MKLSLVVLTPGSAEGKIISINVTPFYIGRDPGCHLRPTSLHISKRHCALVRRGDQSFVLDFDSTNGTFVNDQQVKGGIELLNGDQLRVGPLLFAVHMESIPVDLPTPIPATKATMQKHAPGLAASLPAKQPARSVADEDESASMLMSMQDSEAAAAGSCREVPQDSSVHDRAISTAAANEKQKQASEDPSTAAKSIRDEYLK